MSYIEGLGGQAMKTCQNNGGAEMKAKKSRVILSGVSLLLVLCLLAGGTMAWFTDTEKVATNFSAGILDVSVKPGE